MIPLQRSLPRTYGSDAAAAASTHTHAHMLTAAATRHTIPRYEDYLDSQITGTDMYYLEDLELARQLVELG